MTTRQPILKTPEEIEHMRQAGRIVALAHQAMRDALQPGISTARLDAIAEEVIRSHGAIPAFLNYAPGNHPPYPATITACINEELVHGIPRHDAILREGDIISLDTACFYEGWVGDAAITCAVGDVPPIVQRLLHAAEQTLHAAIDVCKIGNKISDIARTTTRVASQYGYSVAREYTGHGVGRAMHEAPSVPNWWARPKRNQQTIWQDYDLQVGMTFAIEPMLIAGRADLYEKEDGWTVATRDKSLCAHVEHTVAITHEGVRILTLP